mgnify:CR=1 FL=1
MTKDIFFVSSDSGCQRTCGALGLRADIAVQLLAMESSSAPVSSSGSSLPSRDQVSSHQSGASSKTHFHDLVFSEAVASDCLVVLSPGLGALHVVSRLLALHTASSAHGRVTFIIGALSYASILCDLLEARGVPQDELPVTITNESSASDRKGIYSRGGLVIITSRILVVDLLMHRVDAQRAAAAVILDAHRVSETSTEAFILRLLKQLNPAASIKAFTEDPEAIASGFNRLEKLMRALHVRKLSVWPRFHVAVSGTLDASPPEIVEVAQPLTPAMHAIQVAIVEAMDACVSELRKSAAVDLSDLTLEKGMTENFDHFIRRQLEPVWNKVSYTVKNVVNELKTLRKLLSYLLRYDAVTFYTYLETLHTSSRFQRDPDMWMLTPQAESLFTTAKARLFTCIRTSVQPAALGAADREHLFEGLWVQHASTNKSVPAKAQYVRLQVNLQPNPKWTALLELLHEVQNHWVQAFSPQGATAAGDAPHTDALCGSAALVVVKDERAAAQVSAVLQRGSMAFLLSRFRSWLLMYGERTRQLRDAYMRWAEKAAQGDLDESTRVPVTAEQLLLWQALERCDVGGDFLAALTRKRARGETATDVARAVADTVDLTADDEAPKSCTAPISTQGSLFPRLSVSVVSVGQLLDDACLLSDTRPTFVVCYDPDPRVTRQLEVYKALHAAKRPMRVYFVLHDNSVEQHGYTSALAREQDAFEKLIHAKAHMALPAQESVQISPHHVGSAAAQSASAAMAASSAGNTSVKTMAVTGQGGAAEWARAQEFAALAETSGDSRAAARGSRLGASVQGLVGVKDEGKRTVVVDMREFRSKLPSLLHAAGMHVVPITLNVGDFVLSPEVCVERKSVPDLYGSFASGRLHSQATAMVRSYQKPVLLIEFDTSRPFALMNSPDLPAEVDVTHIISKMVLLTTAFPTLRIMWSRSPHATVDIFMALKQRMPEPDAETAAAIGTDGEVPAAAPADAAPGAAAAPPVQLIRNMDTRNDPAIDLLRSLPGVTGGNYRTILSCVDSLAELCSLPLALLGEIMGPGHAAQLHGFLHRGRSEGQDEAEVTDSGVGGGMNIVTYFQQQQDGASQVVHVPTHKAAPPTSALTSSTSQQLSPPKGRKRTRSESN